MIVGVDPGERRIGVAVADPETRFARPLVVIDARDTDPVERVLEVAAETGAGMIVVGRPVALAGNDGRAVDVQQEFVAALRKRSPVDVREYDERFTTVVAERALRDAGADSSRRKELRDAVAAQVMLQGYLDSTA
jgi:putative Holliday junction resolvase